MKPILSTPVLSAAAAPTRKDPSCSAKVKPAMLSAIGPPVSKLIMALSTTAKLVSGFTPATVSVSPANKNPTPITRSLESAAS